MEKLSETKCFGGKQIQYKHRSEVLDCDMVFSIYLPPQAGLEPVPALYWLSGLTCTDQNFVTKAGAQRYAAEFGIAIVAPDTSPRGDDVADAPERYDLGVGAGFYVNATQAPWSAHFHMHSYICDELPAVVEAALPVIPGLMSVAGHSMGGHGALVCSLRHPGTYHSVSAFAPIVNPVNCDWGKGCLGAYLGDDMAAWKEWDATELIRGGAQSLPLFIDQGAADEFLETQLLPGNLEQACIDQKIPITLRMQPGYDHSYYFIASFIGEHVAYHAEALRGATAA